MKTWLEPAIASGDYFTKNLNVYHSDRDCTKGKSFGGGVLIALDRSITSLRRSDIKNVNESVWVGLCCPGEQKILLSTFYFSPNIHLHEYESGISAIKNVVRTNPCHDFCIAGDFNAPVIDCLDGTVQHQNAYAIRRGTSLLDFSFTDLQQKMV